MPKQAAHALLEGLFNRVGMRFPRGRGKNCETDDRGTILAGVIADLDGLNRATERDFLDIGAKLTEFHRTTRQIAADAAALRDLISGKDGLHASDVLTRLLEHSQQAEVRAKAGGEVLASVRDSAGRIGRTFAGFRDTVSVFRILGHLARIETARLGAAGAEFGNLAEEVNALTQCIETSGQGILDASAILHQSVQSALTRIADVRAGELQALYTLVAEVKASLGSLDALHRRTGEVSVHQAAEYGEVSAAIEDLITAIQFHDITRQQVEHVADALRRLSCELQQGRGIRAAPSRDAAAVLTLQASQLTHAERLFASSFGRIERALDSIGARVGNIAEASRTLMGASTDQHGSSFLPLEGRLTAILNILGSCANADSETHSALAGLEKTVLRMRASVDEVRQIEIRIRRIALNATVRAVQIGQSANALDVVAQRMHRLALDSNEITEAVAGTLNGITGAIDAFSGASDWMPGDAGADASAVHSEIRAMILDLHSSSEASFSRLNQITASGSRFRDEIQAVRAGLSAGPLFSRAISNALSAFERISGQAARMPSGDSQAAANQDLEDLATHYTMQAERDVHDALLAGARTPGSAPAVAAIVAQGEEDLGDNVELF